MKTILLAATAALALAGCVPQQRPLPALSAGDILTDAIARSTGSAVARLERCGVPPDRARVIRNNLGSARGDPAYIAAEAAAAEARERTAPPPTEAQCAEARRMMAAAQHRVISRAAGHLELCGMAPDRVRRTMAPLWAAAGLAADWSTELNARQAIQVWHAALRERTQPNCGFLLAWARDTERENRTAAPAAARATGGNIALPIDQLR